MVVVGVLALQGAFSEHIQLLRVAADELRSKDTSSPTWEFKEVRTEEQLASCDALILPGGESTAISLMAARSGLLEPLRDFVKFVPPSGVSEHITHDVYRVHRKPTWGTCAGLILLSESANRTKRGGQELIGGLDIRSNRNHFGRQVDSFQADLSLSFLGKEEAPFRAVFIRAPVVENILPHQSGIQKEEATREETVVAPSKQPGNEFARKALSNEVEILARLPGNAKSLVHEKVDAHNAGEEGDIIAVRQGNVFGTSFHPELTGDARIHVWFLEQFVASLRRQ